MNPAIGEMESMDSLIFREGIQPLRCHGLSHFAPVGLQNSPRENYSSGIFVFLTNRTFPMTIALSTALHMS